MAKYIAVYSSPLIKGIYKVCCEEVVYGTYTSRDTPGVFHLVISRYVNEAELKLVRIESILTRLGECVSPCFYRVGLDDIRNIFELIDDVTERLHQGRTPPYPKSTTGPGCRKAHKCLFDGQQVRHKARKTEDIWYATYSAEKKGFVYNDTVSSLTNFVKSHYKAVRPERTGWAWAWKECECMLENGEWVSTNYLPERT